MRKLTFALWLFLIPVVFFAQEASVIQQIKKEGLENSQVMDIAFHLTEKSGPRLMNSPGYYRAMDYSVNQLKEWGLENVKKDEWGDFGKGWELKKFYIAMKSPWYKPIIAFPKAWTSSTNGFKTSDVILVDPEADSTALVTKYRGKLSGKILAMDKLISYELDDRADLELKPAHEKFNVYFNLDNGTGRINGIYLQENEAARAVMEKWLGAFEDLGATTITAGNTGGTDHLSFDGVGLPGFQFIQDQVEYNSRTHHSNMDSYDHLVEEDLKQAATVVAGLIYQAAMSDQKVPRKELPKAQASRF